jgi:hypothetical protein
MTETVLQRLLTEQQAKEMKQEMENIPSPEAMAEGKSWELALSFTAEDAPHIVDELEEKLNGS